MKGHYSHVGMCLDKENIIHSTKIGVNVENLYKFLRCDDIMIVRTEDKSIIEKAIVKAKYYLNKEVGYDYKFDSTDDNALYCTEFVNNCFKLGLDDKHFFIMPDYFVDMPNFETVWVKG